MTEKGKRLFAFLGIALTVASFYVRNASFYPPIQALLAPSYTAAKRGLQTLKADGSLGVGQPEFPSIAAVVERRLAELNPVISRPDIIVKKLETAGGGISFGASEVKQTVGLKVTVFGQNDPVQMDLVELADLVEREWESRAVMWGSLLLWIGVIVSFRAATWPPKPKDLPPPRTDEAKDAAA